MPHYIFDADTLDLMAQVDITEHSPLKKYPKRCPKCNSSVYGDRCSDHKHPVESIGVETPEECANITHTFRDGYKRDQMFPAHGDEYSFIGAFRKFAREVKCQPWDKEHPHIDVTEPDVHLFTIYGAGGWHRWMVTVSGEVRFSFHHAHTVKQDLALALGFRRW